MYLYLYLYLYLYDLKVWGTFTWQFALLAVQPILCPHTLEASRRQNISTSKLQKVYLPFLRLWSTCYFLRFKIARVIAAVSGIKDKLRKRRLFVQQNLCIIRIRLPKIYIYPGAKTYVSYGAIYLPKYPKPHSQSCEPHSENSMSNVYWQTCLSLQNYKQYQEHQDTWVQQWALWCLPKQISVPINSRGLWMVPSGDFILRKCSYLFQLTNATFSKFWLTTRKCRVGEK